MSDSAFVPTKGRHEGRLLEERKRAERGKNLIVLMLQHLTNAGYTGSVEALQAESGVSLSQYAAADNVELISALQEWEDYYELRFARRPKLVNKLSNFSSEVEGKRVMGGAPSRGNLTGGSGTNAARARRASAAAAAAGAPSDDGAPADAPPKGSSGSSSARGRPNGGKENGAQGQRSDPGAAPTDPTGLVVSGHVPGSKELRPAHGGGRAGGAGGDGDEAPGPWEHRLRKAGLPPAMAANAELRELAGWLQRDMIQSNPNVRWDDIAELDGVKRVLKESLVMPLRYPEYFTGLLQPWKGVLLYGPPGTGKTLLAKAVATECNTTFFNISASSIVSKWRGDSEKLVRVLFELARHHAPSTIFVDEIDALMSARGDSGEHEGSRRMKTELLVQMDGLLASTEQVFLLAATNLPWELDMALLRRLEKRVLVPFPTAPARELILRRTLPADRLDAAADLGKLAELTEGYSGSDLVLVAKEAAMRPLRRLLATLDLDSQRPAGARAPAPGLVDADDLAAALSSTKASVATYADRYAQWESEFGSV
jgi:katanin p60 ATPase-containing subunit A1